MKNQTEIVKVVLYIYTIVYKPPSWSQSQLSLALIIFRLLVFLSFKMRRWKKYK